MRAETCPERDRLSVDAQAIWDRHVAERGLPQTAPRRDALAVYCAHLAQIEDLQGRIAREGTIVASDKGTPVEHPACRVLERALGVLPKLAAALR